VDYRIGADVVAITVADAQTEQGETDATTGQTTLNVIGYNTLPIEDLLTIEGVANASRVGRYPARLVVTNQRVEGTVLGVDRAAIAAVTRSRDDYSDESLAELFNRLAGNRTGLLISRNTAATYNLRINQEVTYQVQALNQWYELKAPIVGVLDYFPTLDPSRGFFAVTNLDPIFEAVGTQLPHDYWISLEANADPQVVRQEAARLGYPILEWRDPEIALKAAQAAPSRRGVLGFLSVGFVAAIVLTLVGAVIQTTASFRAQVTQLGSLRAMGMGGGSVSAYLTLVQGLAAASGIASGTSVGVATTILFLPLLDFSGGLPPYLVRVAWGDITLVYLIFAGVLLAVTVVTTIVLGRENLAALVKLGDV
jgi:putative ABC transport system permease protein